MESGIIFHCYNGPLSNGQKIPLINITWYDNGDQNSETMSWLVAGLCHVDDFSDMT